ncbi:MAG: SPFH domain-containing protein [Phycisphaeraceae bacterium]
MANDAQTYRRATNAAFVGLGTQALLFAAFGLLGLYAQSGAINALAWHTAAGLPIWVALIILYYQHRLEQEEALEAERLTRSDRRAAALFEEAGANLQLSRQRLEWLQKWGLTIASILTASLLLAIGPSLLYSHYLRIANDAIEPWVRGDVHHGLLIILLASFAFVGFLVGRFISGMTRTESWLALRGGAGTLMGTVFLALLSIVAVVLHMVGFEPAFEWLALAVPAVTTLIGLEVFANLVLALYQPRRPGQFVRPAFDSRLLGWMSSPESIGKIVSETLAYQFGFDLSKSYAYRQLMRLLTPMFLVAVVTLFGMTSLVVVEPQQQAVIKTFGQLSDRVLSAGLHVKAPWPISTISRHDVYRVSELRMGSTEGAERRHDAAILWTNEHVEGQETYLVTAPSRFPDQPESSDIAAGELVGGDVIIKYRINPEGGLLEYLTSAVSPEAVFSSVASRRMNQYFATRQIDDLLRSDRIEASRALLVDIQRDVDGLDLGIEVLAISITSMHPPQAGEVAQSFHDQIGALQESLSEVNRANRDAVTTLAEVAGSREQALAISDAIQRLERLRLQLAAENTADLQGEVSRQEALIEELVADAGGRAAQLIAQARAFRWQYAIEERAKSEQFPAEIAAFTHAPDYFKARRYFEALTQSLENRPKIILAKPDITSPVEDRVIELDLQESRTGLESILGSNN